MTVDKTGFTITFYGDFQPSHSSKVGSKIHGLNSGMDFYAVTKMLDKHPEVSWFLVYDEYQEIYVTHKDCPSAFNSLKWRLPKSISRKSSNN